MSRAWKPGDVAMVTATNRGNHYRAYFDGEMWREAASPSFCLIEPTDIRPLVVIDPEDRDQVKRLYDGYYSICGGIDAMQAALREFANPTPPKPEEPTGLGAVVEVAHPVYEWARADRIERSSAPWWYTDSSGNGGWRTWGELRGYAVRVVHEGVTP